MKHREKAYSEKELAMFQAVISLIEEDIDVNTIKVSDITNRAGIGKGTAYEYFSSKDEMVAEALSWSASMELNKILALIKEMNSLEEQIFTVMDFIENEMSSRRFNVHLLHIHSGSCEVSKKLAGACKKKDQMQRNIDKVLEVLIAQGIQEGRISKQAKKSSLFMILFPGFVGYFLYLIKDRMGGESEPKEVKELLCRNMLRNLEEECGVS